jgi:hypothetical protein
MPDLIRAGTVGGVVPKTDWEVNPFPPAGFMHLPNRMMTVGMTEGASEKIPIQKASDIMRVGVSMIDRPKTDRVIFI